MSTSPDTYKAAWNARSSSLAAAMLAVDGSASEEVLALTGAYTARQVHAALDLLPADRVFEIGCGVGRIGAQLAGHVAEWHGLDIAENMAALAHARVAAHPGARASALAGPRLSPLADASMDKGYCVAVFIHMDKEDMNLYLREVVRVLRPGGLFYFDHWNLAHPVGWQRFTYEVDEIGRSDPAQRKDVARNQFCTPEEVRLYVRAAGLELVFEHTDSPWIQAVARKPEHPLPRAAPSPAPIEPAALSAGAAAEAARLAAARAEIGFTPAWTRCFAQSCEVLIGGRHPALLLDEWRREAEPAPEIPLFIAWLEAVWRHNPHLWPPAAA
ncbi:MAG: class I SAM-dependent methyltransferase [Silanimonas lenta]